MVRSSRGIGDARREGVFDEPLPQVCCRVAVDDGALPPTKGLPSISNPDRRTPRAKQVGTAVLRLALGAPRPEGPHDRRVQASPHR